MSENEETKRHHPTPAREQEPVRGRQKDEGQTGGANRAVSGNAGHSSPNVVEEQKKSDRGLKPGQDSKGSGR